MNHEIIKQDEINLEIRKFEPTDPAHADVFNEPINALLNNDAYLDEKIEETADDIKKYLGINSRNLLFHNMESSLSMGLTITVNDDKSITYTGVSTGFISQMISLHENRIYITEDLILSGCPTGGSDKTYYMGVRVSTDDGASLSFKDTGNGVTIPLSEVGEYAYISYLSISFSQGVNCGSGITFKPMIRLASETDGTYEPYREDRIKNLENSVNEVKSGLDTIEMELFGNSNTGLLFQKIGKLVILHFASFHTYDYNGQAVIPEKYLPNNPLTVMGIAYQSKDNCRHCNIDLQTDGTIDSYILDDATTSRTENTTLGVYGQAVYFTN